MAPARLLRSAAVVVALAVPAAACGGDEPDSTAEWADGVCSSITNWTDEITTSVSSLQGGNLSQDTLSGVVDDVKGATEDLGSDLDDLGGPDTESAQEAEETLSALSDGLTAQIEQIESALEDASGLSETLAAASAATASVEAMAAQVETTIATLRGLEPVDELQSAFESSDDCDEISQSLAELESGSR